MRNDRRCAEAGLTLIELLLSAVISLIVGAGGFLFLRGQIVSFGNQSAGLDAIEGARASLEFMSNDIRMTGANVAGAPRWFGTGTCVGRANSFTATWDDGLAANGAAPNHSVRYWYDADNKRVVRTLAGTDSTLIENVPANGLSFQYFLTNGSSAAMTGTPSQVTSCDGVAVIRVTVKVTAARAAQVFTVDLGARVALRNRASALARM